MYGNNWELQAIFYPSILERCLGHDSSCLCIQWIVNNSHYFTPAANNMLTLFTFWQPAQHFGWIFERIHTYVKKKHIKRWVVRCSLYLWMLKSAKTKICFSVLLDKGQRWKQQMDPFVTHFSWWHTIFLKVRQMLL